MSVADLHGVPDHVVRLVHVADLPGTQAEGGNFGNSRRVARSPGLDRLGWGGGDGAQNGTYYKRNGDHFQTGFAPNREMGKSLEKSDGPDREWI